MKRIINFLVVGFCLLMFVQSCTKEMSEETIGLRGTAEGVLTDSLGNCKNATIKGKYVIDTALTDSNYVIVNVNITVTGKYRIFSDTVNGMWFLDSGFALSTGATTVKLKGKGTPLLPGSSDFIVSFGNSFCKFTVTTLGPNNGSSTLDYLPITANGLIVYQLIPGIQLSNATTLDSFPATISPNSFVSGFVPPRTYYKYETLTLGGENYYSKDGNGNYFTIGTPEFEYLSVYDYIQNNIEYVYLKDNVNTGNSWMTDTVRAGLVLGSNITDTTFGFAKLGHTIISKNLTVSLLGNGYSNVIQVRRDLLFRANTSSKYDTIVTGQLFYAKGIGLIDQVIGTGSNTQSLTIKRQNGL
ncbi:MAG: hypothetical protein RL596_658 [Bacteroidota bacterium]